MKEDTKEDIQRLNKIVDYIHYKGPFKMLKFFIIISVFIPIYSSIFLKLSGIKYNFRKHY